MAYKKIIAYINAEHEMENNILQMAERYALNGADELFICNYTQEDEFKENFLSVMKKLEKLIDIPFSIGLYVERFEDVKKALYTGACYVVVKDELIVKEALEEAIKRFGNDKIFVEISALEAFCQTEHFMFLQEVGIYGYLLKHVSITAKFKECLQKINRPIVIRDSLERNDLCTLLMLDYVQGVATNHFENKDLQKAKCALKEQGVPVNTFESSLQFSEFKLNSDGMIPVVTQDYKTNEVLMVGYMNEEAFQHTITSGKMTYWSRSRNELWCKGDTSGHYQYVKSLAIDCDYDTILAKVHQIGSACHTGNKSCFFTEIAKKEYDTTNPLTVFSDVYHTILDRKENPKEGSYTNYLLEKGIDKILKKCGEEATEIVIAAKNPDKEEIKYEISDFLYHLMVLMVECKVSWNDVVKELAHRR